MNLKTAARRLGVHYQTAYKWVRSGELVAVKIGLRYDISEAALVRFEAERAAVVREPAPIARPEVVPPTGRNDVLQELNEMTSRVIVDAVPVFRLVARRAAEVVGDVCIVRLLSDDGRWLEPVAFDHVDPDRLALVGAIITAMPEEYGRGPVGTVVSRGKARLIEHVPQDAVRARMLPELRQHLDEFGIHSLAMAPVRVEGNSVGLVALSRDEPGRPYTSSDLALVEQLASVVGRAVARAQEFAAAWKERGDLKERIEAILASGFDPEGPEQDLTPLDEWLEDCLAADEVPEAVLDVEGRFLAVNEQFCQLVGHDRDALAALTCADITHPEDHEHEQQLIDKLISGELDYYDEKVRRVTRDGAIVACVVHRSAARTPDATLRCIVTVLRPLDP